MDSDTSYSSEYNTNQNNSGLLRFRSAPSSFFLDGVAEKSGKISDEISRFNLSSSGAGYGNNNQFSHGGLQFLEDKDNNKKATANNYASISSQLLPPQYPNPIPIPIPRPTTSAIPPSQLGSVNGGYGVNPQGGIVGSSSLMRQNSSPAGLFSQNGYAKMRGIPSYAFSNGTSSNGSSIRDLGCSSGNGIPSSFGMLSRISEVENDEKIGTREEAQFYGSNFPLYGNNGSSNYSGNFTGLKREIDPDQGLFSDNQGGEEPINQPPVLSHHLSLPKTSSEIAAMEKLIQFQDAVPCKIRAKRGCATHPRSIAERVRRTRISERMRKLQELVPNMEKQTNTADMLDLAVEYIKDLQKQYKTLTDIRANCKCSSTQNSVSDQMF